ncbi:MAG: sortase [Chloroflexota bacterium]|nr:sortase [Chloroflexota bacterium]
MTRAHNLARSALSIGILLLALSPCVTRAAADPPVSPLYCAGPQHNKIPFHGTIVVYAGIPSVCQVLILGAALLTADGGVAPQIPHKGRAVFRVTGDGLDRPGAVTIVAGASREPGNAPETEDLRHGATLRLVPGTVLVRYDFATDKYVAVPDDKISRAFVAYKIIRRGAAAMLQPTRTLAPSTLPATGGGPLRAVPLLAGVLLLLRRRHARGGRSGGRRARLGRLAAGGVVLAVVLGGVYSVARRQVTSDGFGTLEGSQGPLPRGPGASGPPTRLVIPAIGVDTGMTPPLEVVGGAWQLPSYGTGYLAGSAWPGRAGNEVIAGHDDAYGAVFRRLSDLRVGDEVRVYADAQVYRYRVLALRIVPPTRTDVVRPTRGATLTLITCTPYLVDTDRLVVRAQLRI